MKIDSDFVVSIDFTLKDDAGEVIDRSEPHHPLVYLHGHQNIIPGLEAALNAKEIGDSLQVTVQPEDAYGVTNPALRQLVTRDRFQDVADLQVGMQFQANTEQGPISVRVAKIEGEQVTLMVTIRWQANNYTLTWRLWIFAWLLMKKSSMGMCTNPAVAVVVDHAERILVLTARVLAAQISSILTMLSAGVRARSG